MAKCEQRVQARAGRDTSTFANCRFRDPTRQKEQTCLNDLELLRRLVVTSKPTERATDAAGTAARWYDTYHVRQARKASAERHRFQPRILQQMANCAP